MAKKTYVPGKEEKKQLADARKKLQAKDSRKPSGVGLAVHEILKGTKK